MSEQHTPGPWRFEFNAKHRSVHLVGGRPRFDLTIMDFCRWGMGGATMRLRDTAHDGMNMMYKLHDRPDWIAPEPGREHHKDWFQRVVHPDIRLIEAAPDLLEALKEVAEVFGEDWREGSTQRYLGDRARAAIAKVEGGGV